MISSPYELVLGEIEKGRVNPFDVDLDYLIELFRETAKELESGDYLREAGRFLEATAKLMKLQIEEIFPRPKPERKRVTIEQVKEVLVEEPEEEISYDMSFIYSYAPKIGRPSGAKDRVERKLTWREFWEKAQSVPLHREIDYHELARKLRDSYLKTGKLKIESITDFIAYLFAYHEFEDVPAVEF